jgi:pyrroloquinoline-quinone synthase
MTPEPWSKEEFFNRLQEVGTHSYHHLHPFHVRMNAGLLDQDSIRLWVANRYYYQRHIPLKDAAILANCPLREVRREWIKRILDHDGNDECEGGIERWVRLGIACGLTRETIMGERHVRPGVRFAVDAYVNFARSQPWPVAIASSLTELFAPELMAKRLEAFEQHYPWVASQGLDYFRTRLAQARKDAEFALAATLKYCTDRKLQEAGVEALRFKCEVLWSMLDAIANVSGPDRV